MEKQDFSYRILTERKHLHCTISGPVNNQRIKEIADAVLQAAEQHGLKNVLFDCHNVPLNTQVAKCVKDSLELMHVFLDKIAVCVHDFKVFSSAKFTQLITNTKKYKIFRTNEEALKWFSTNTPVVEKQPFRYHLERKEPYVFLKAEGTPSAADVNKMGSELLELLEASASRRLLFDVEKLVVSYAVFTTGREWHNKIYSTIEKAASYSSNVKVLAFAKFLRLVSGNKEKWKMFSNKKSAHNWLIK